jgi:multiple antibiotic resistance protein
MINSLMHIFDLFDKKEFVSAFIVLFAIINVVGVIPIVINLRQDGKIVSASRASVISLGLFMGFMYMGNAFLSLFGLDVSSFAIAGSIIIFIISMEMILDVHIFHQSKYSSSDATFTPIVFPLIAGAGAFTTIISLRSQYSEFNIILAILCNVVIIYLAIAASSKLEKILSPGIMCIFQKAFGIILLSISVKLFTSNLTHLINNFAS